MEIDLVLLLYPVSSVMLLGALLGSNGNDLFRPLKLIYTCVLVVSWITAFLKFSFESLLPIAVDSLQTRKSAAAENPC